MDIKMIGCSRRCDTWCVKGLIDAEKLIKMEKLYENLLKSNSKSLLRKHLNRDLYNSLKFIRTHKGITLLECIKSGLENYDALIGINAPEPDSYKIFANIFNPIIEDYHMGFQPNALHPYPRWGDVNAIENIDPDEKYIRSVRISVSRNLSYYPFISQLEKHDFRQIQRIVARAFKALPEELRGVYRPLKILSEEEVQEFRNDHILFENTNPILMSGNVYNYWPSGRGIFYNDNLDFVVWVNQKDHIRVISIEENGNIGDVYRRLYKGIGSLTKQLNFCRNRRLGYLTFCPSRLGTTLNISVQIKVCYLPRQKNIFKSIADQRNLVIKRVPGDHPKGVCYYQISNKFSLGKTEFQFMKEFCDGVSEIISAEQELQEKALAEAALLAEANKEETSAEEQS
ncbi:arginine kinase-like [Agrilus planipennis]|uniref:arginine kinase n=1 Tax=Agrilus planipennis TaxID=224129 RepID=A0A1W4XUW0_AGRPL|nr:arginine kinase-like [Agrilus planipennis]